MHQDLGGETSKVVSKRPDTEDRMNEKKNIRAISSAQDVNEPRLLADSLYNQ